MLIGAGGMGKEIAYLVEVINRKTSAGIKLAGFAVEKEYYIEGQSIMGYPMIGDLDWVKCHKDDIICACCIGYPQPRKRVMKELKNGGVDFMNLIHPDIEIPSGTSIGNGCIIQHGSGISVDVRIGDGVFLNGDLGIGHDAILGDYVTVFPGTRISGKCSIGEAVTIGAMSFIMERVKIGNNAVIAPGSVVYSKIKEGTHVMGNPAHRVDL